VLNIAIPDEKVVNYQELFIDCPISIHGQDFLGNLYKFKLMKFDVSLDMD